MKEAEKLVKKIDKVKDVLDEVYNKLDEVFIHDEDLDSTLSMINVVDDKGKKLPKKKRKEMLLDYLDKKFPNLSKQLDEFAMISEAIQLKVDSAKDKIESSLEEIDEIESEQDELQERIDNLR